MTILSPNRHFLGVERFTTGRLWRDRLDDRGNARSRAIAQRDSVPEMPARPATLDCGLLRRHRNGDAVQRGIGGHLMISGGAMSGGIFYFWRSHTATVSGSITRREQCAGCSCLFEYEITRTATGGGHSPLFLTDATAKAAAQQRARINLSLALNEAIEPVHCPRCGIFQPDMVPVLRERHGGRYEANKYASERIAVPIEDAFCNACAANTIESYARFREVWPTFSEHVEDRIRALKYPRLRKWMSRLGWLAWGAIALIFAVFVVLSVVPW